MVATYPHALNTLMGCMALHIEYVFTSFASHNIYLATAWGQWMVGQLWTRIQSLHQPCTRNKDVHMRIPLPAALEVLSGGGFYQGYVHIKATSSLHFSLPPPTFFFLSFLQTPSTHTPRMPKQRSRRRNRRAQEDADQRVEECTKTARRRECRKRKKKKKKGKVRKGNEQNEIAHALFVVPFPPLTRPQNNEPRSSNQIFIWRSYNQILIWCSGGFGGDRAVSTTGGTTHVPRRYLDNATTRSFLSL